LRRPFSLSARFQHAAGRGDAMRRPSPVAV